jgi:hypothetical protein
MLVTAAMPEAMFQAVARRFCFNAAIAGKCV